MISMTAKWEVRSLQDLRDMLLSDTRGMVGAFKLSMGEAVHYWRRTYAKEHFEETAYSRYPGQAVRARYANMRPVDPNSTNGTVNRKWEVIFQQRTGLIQASLKMRKQFWKGMKMDNRPMVFTGKTRRGILTGKFTVKGTSKSVRGSWDDQDINWYGLSRGTWSSPSRSLGDTLVYANQQEFDDLTARIANDYFPFYAALATSRSGMPSLADLPMLN